MKIKPKGKILKERYTNKDKKILTSKLRFRGTFCEDLFCELFLRQQLVLDS